MISVWVGSPGDWVGVATLTLVAFPVVGQSQ